MNIEQIKEKLKLRRLDNKAVRLVNQEQRERHILNSIMNAFHTFPEKYFHFADIKGQKPDYEESRIEKVSNIENILDEILQEQECFSLKDLVVNGNDVKKTMNLKEGKDVGYWLNEILKRVIDGELKNNRDDLIYWMTGVTDGWIKL